MSNLTYTDCSLRVRYAETDQMGVAYHGNYLVWFEVGRSEFCRQHGFSYQSTYDAILSTPIGVESLGAGEILWGASKAAFDSLLIMLILFAFGVLHSPMSILIPLVILLGATGLASIAFAYTVSISSIYQYNYFIALAFSSLWICGAYFPVDRLPLALQYLSWSLPITSVVNLSRDLMTGRLDSWSLFQALWILISTLVFADLALRRLARRMYR